MNTKAFYKSRKLAYALGTFLAALVLTLLPTLVDLEPETLDALETMLPLVFVTGVAALFGHTFTDVAHQWKEGVAGKGLEDAAHDLLEALFELLDDKPDAPEQLLAEPPAPEVAREVELGDAAK